jgi:hypothetical protein
MRISDPVPNIYTASTLASVKIKCPKVDVIYLYPDADARAFDRKNPASVIFVSPEWLFGKSKNMDKVKSLHEQKQLELIAIDEAHLIYEWDGFRA